MNVPQWTIVGYCPRNSSVGTIIAGGDKRIADSLPPKQKLAATRCMLGLKVTYATYNGDLAQRKWPSNRAATIPKAPYLILLVKRIPKLGCDEEVLSFEDASCKRFLQSLPHLFLVTVRPSTVDVLREG